MKNKIVKPEASFTSEDLLNMPLHSWVRVNHQTIVLRVPGGWIYETEVSATNYDEEVGISVSTVFVPEIK